MATPRCQQGKSISIAQEQTYWDMLAYSVFVVSDFSGFTQFYTHVLKKTTYHSHENMALAVWKNPPLTPAVAYPQYVSSLILLVWSGLYRKNVIPYDPLFIYF